MRITRQRIFSEKKEEKGSKILPNGLMAGGGILGGYGAYKTVQAHLDANGEQKTLNKNIEAARELLEKRNKHGEEYAAQERARAIEKSGKRLRENIQDEYEEFKSLRKKNPNMTLDAKAIAEKATKKEAARREKELKEIMNNYQRQIDRNKKWLEDDVAYYKETSAKNMKAIKSNKIKGLAGIGLGAATIGTGYYLDKRNKNKK